ncbi:MAG: manC [Clostridia bacterium]|jgi:mannose-1-phosphate guanylyltransferase|nr:manC [Clostridia bacterium]
MKMYGVIMAGGSGTRFWPLSRQNISKQLLNLNGEGMMINKTIIRVSRFINKKDIFVVTNALQSEIIAEATAEYISRDQILSEPVSKNTGVCIGYTAFKIMKKYGDGIMCVFPSDHFIKNEEALAQVVTQAQEVAYLQDKLVTIGIRPTFPSTGYGYIKYDRFAQRAAKDVIQFVEKPDSETAKAYINSGDYVWNSGIFIWKVSTILKEFERYLPEVYEKLCEIADSMGTEKEYETIGRVYPTIPSISIDSGIIEHSDRVLMLTGEFIWNDIGSWDTLGVLHDEDIRGNVVCGEHINLDTKNCIIYSSERLIATIGVENLVVVETKDVVLICNKESAQDVKKIVEMLRGEEKLQYL